MCYSAQTGLSVFKGRRTLWAETEEDDITPLQQETLDEICRYVSAKGYPPTVKEMSETFGISHASVHDRINQLVRKGYLKERKVRLAV